MTTLEDKRVAVKEYIDFAENLDFPFMYGADSDKTTNEAMICVGMNDEVCAFLTPYIDYLDTLSIKTMVMANMNSGEQQVLKSYIDNYGPGNYPTEDDYIDFMEVDTGTEFYFYASSLDTICQIEQVYRMEAEIASHK